MSIGEIVGLTMKSVTQKEKERILFECTDGRMFAMYHNGDCCESVEIEDVNGDLQDLVGSPITQAEESTNSENPPKDLESDSFTWTFYRLATPKGGVVIRWLGQSSGYYSEEVSFEEVPA